MKNWIIGGLTGACVGVSVYLFFSKKPTPAPTRDEPPAAPAAAAPPAPPAPAVLDRVVEVADIDGLLDPPAREIAGEPFESETTAAPVSAPAVPIPPAVD